MFKKCQEQLVSRAVEELKERGYILLEYEGTDKYRFKVMKAGMLPHLFTVRSLLQFTDKHVAVGRRELA